MNLREEMKYLRRQKSYGIHGKKITFESDGLIFTPILEHYQKRGGSWFSLFKWKPAELNSIDFLIKIVKNDDGQDEINPLIKEKTNADGKVKEHLKDTKQLNYM